MRLHSARRIHQESGANTKPEHIFDYFCQAIAVPNYAFANVFTLLSACRIQEGAVFNNRNQ
jgi:hypothetical protein